uniref:Uncharacterized protein n=1 Tax=Panagrolaimus davidi TaxID=227884 RepID=A0A914QII8_9BILA
MMAMTTAYQALQKSDDDDHEKHHGIICDFKESFKDVVQQIKGKDEDTVGDQHFERKKSSITKPRRQSFSESIRSALKSRKQSKKLDRKVSVDDEFDEDEELPQFSKSAYVHPVSKALPTSQNHRNRTNSETMPTSVKPRRQPTIDFSRSMQTSSKSRQQSEIDFSESFESSAPNSRMASLIDFSESFLSIMKSRKQSKNDMEIISDAGENSPTTSSPFKNSSANSFNNSGHNPFTGSINGKLIDAGDHVQVLCKPHIDEINH